jgi:hypothetical protein
MKSESGMRVAVTGTLGFMLIIGWKGKMQFKKFIIFGGSGFIGTHTKNLLKKSTRSKNCNSRHTCKWCR